MSDKYNLNEYKESFQMMNLFINENSCPNQPGPL